MTTQLNGGAQQTWLTLQHMALCFRAPTSSLMAGMTFQNPHHASCMYVPQLYPCDEMSHLFRPYNTLEQRLTLTPVPGICTDQV